MKLNCPISTIIEIRFPDSSSPSKSAKAPEQEDRWSDYGDGEVVVMGGSHDSYSI